MWSHTAARKPPSWVGVCRWEEVRSRPHWAPNPQALSGVDSGTVLWFALMGCAEDGWAEDWWAGTGRVPRKPLCGPFTVSEARQRLCSGPLGLRRLQPVVAPGWGPISLGKQSASDHCAFQIKALFPKLRFMPAAHVYQGRRGVGAQLSGLFWDSSVQERRPSL